MRACVFILCSFQVLGGTEEPVEGHNDEVDDVCIKGPEDVVVRIEGCQEPLEDGEICRIGSCGWIVFVLEVLDESNEYGIVSSGSWAFLSGIVDTQVGDALAHRREYLIDRITSDKFVGGTGLLGHSVSEPENEKVAESVAPTRDIREGRGVVVFGAEGSPPPEGGAGCLA